MSEPLRWLQTNLRQTDSFLDPEKLVAQVAEMRANVLHFGMGGIVAHYPTKLEFHYRSPYLAQTRDMFGDVVQLAHARGIRVVGRFDFSKVKKEAFAAHPDWFFRTADGSPVEYNGLYSTCINGGYYRDYAMRILTEALERYEVDGLFFNMFGNQSRDYSGRFVGHCHCDACKAKYRAMFGRDLPKEMDEQYRQFLFRTSREVAADIGKLIRAKRPRAGYFNYIQEHTDGIMSESNTAVDRPLPLWPYSASDNVNRNRNSEPSKMAVNLCMQFVDFAWRWVTVPGPEIQLRLWQNVAHAGAAALAINGTFEQEDRQGLEAARPVFQWLAEHERYYAGQESDARVLLLGRPAQSGRPFSQNSYRGMFRLLSEEHIPFAVADNLDWMGRREYDLVIATDWAPAELTPYMERGGRVLVANARPPDFEGPRVVKRWDDLQGHLRVRDRGRLPSLRSTNVLMIDGPFAELEPVAKPALTMVPPSMYGPPEFVHIDATDTDVPGLVTMERGKGRMAWIPWDAGALYYRHSLTGHRLLLRDVVRELLGDRTQVVTNAHPLVEVTWMKQGTRRLLHMINVSGHSSTAYFEPVEMRNLRFSVLGTYSGARALRSAEAPSVTRRNGRSEFVVSQLKDYEVVILEP
jgi:hypothetical protein